MRASVARSSCGFSSGQLHRCALHRELARGKLLQYGFDAIVFRARHQRLFQLLKMDRRAVVVADISQLIACQNMSQQFAMLQKRGPFIEES